MGICIFEFVKELNHYCQIKADTQSDALLGMLLDESLSYNAIQWHLGWFYNKNSEWGSSNCICYQKVDDNIILTSEFDEQKFPDECVMPKQTFVKLLEGWSEMLKQLPSYIVIFHDGAELTITAYNHNPLEQNSQD